MNPFERLSMARTSQLVTAAVMLILLSLLEPKTVSGAVIRNSNAVSADLQTARAWARYVTAGPSIWRNGRAPAFSPGVRRLIRQELRVNNASVMPMVQYLLWRRSLNPSRFDFYHRDLGPILSGLPEIPRVTTNIPQGLIPTPGSTPDPIVVPPPPPEPSVPEPAPFLLALMMVGWAIRAKKRLVIDSSR